jgi:hypothetical protein
LYSLFSHAQFRQNRFCCEIGNWGCLLSSYFLYTFSDCSDEDEKLWVWNYNGTPMYMDLDEDVRIFLLCVVLVSRIEGTERERDREREALCSWCDGLTGAIPGGASKVPTNSNRAREECKTVCSHADYCKSFHSIPTASS